MEDVPEMPCLLAILPPPFLGDYAERPVNLFAVFPKAVSCRSFAQNFNFHILIPLRNLSLTYLDKLC